MKEHRLTEGAGPTPGPCEFAELPPHSFDDDYNGNRLENYPSPLSCDVPVIPVIPVIKARLSDACAGLGSAKIWGCFQITSGELLIRAQRAKELGC